MSAEMILFLLCPPNSIFPKRSRYPQLSTSEVINGIFDYQVLYMLYCIVELVHMRSFLEAGTIVSYVAVFQGGLYLWYMLYCKRNKDDIYQHLIL